MRTIKLFSALFIAAAVFTSCTHDELLIPGPAGQDGIDGVDGVDGQDGSAASCISCHAASHREPIEAAWAMSAHASGGTWASRGRSSNCGRCHNKDGFIDVLERNFLDEDGDPIPNPDGYAVGKPLDCTGCHDSHRSFDFENDGNDYAVRSISPVELHYDTSLSVDLSNEVDPLGRSNVCANCHQPRNSYVIPSGVGDYEITSKRFGPHHGPQSTILEGILGANIPGSTGYPGVGSATHRTGASCASCHMGEPTNATDGSHTFNVTPASCTQCHSGIDANTDLASLSIEGWAEGMATLEGLLADAGMFDEDGYYNEGTYPVLLAQAAWNYKTLLEDQSRGIHNPGYVRALLNNTIEALQD